MEQKYDEKKSENVQFSHKKYSTERYPRTYEIDPDGNQSFYRYGDRNGSGEIDRGDSNFKTSPGYDFRGER